jgi:hypothetical protein
MLLLRSKGIDKVNYLTDRTAKCLRGRRFGALTALILLLLLSTNSFSQDAVQTGTPPGLVVSAKVDARQIMIGDQIHLFLEASNVPSGFVLHWPVMPDTFNSLEITNRSKIDTIKQNDKTIYKQRLIITGFDSGMFKIPPFLFSYTATQGSGAFVAPTDSFMVVVQSVAVDTSKGFKGIKGIYYVKGSWLDYIWWIVGVVLLVLLTAFLVWYFVRNKKAAPAPQGPVESLQDYTLRILAELDKRQLWQKKQVKEYYVSLTDIVRNYIERRFRTAAMELTTDEMLTKVQENREMMPYFDLISQILTTADLAKFAKFQPTPQENLDIIDWAKEFVNRSRPVPIAIGSTEPTINDIPTATT